MQGKVGFSPPDLVYHTDGVRTLLLNATVYLLLPTFPLPLFMPGRIFDILMATLNILFAPTERPTLVYICWTWFESDLYIWSCGDAARNFPDYPFCLTCNWSFFTSGFRTPRSRRYNSILCGWEKMWLLYRILLCLSEAMFQLVEEKGMFRIWLEYLLVFSILVDNDILYSFTFTFCMMFEGRVYSHPVVASFHSFCW